MIEGGRFLYTSDMAWFPCLSFDASFIASLGPFDLRMDEHVFFVMLVR